MLKDKPKPGSKIRCVSNWECDFFTNGKIYKVEESPKDGDINYIWIIDDEGDLIYLHSLCDDGFEFEVIKRGY